METATAGLRAALALLGPVAWIDTSVASSNNDRGRPSTQKVTRLAQVLRSVRSNQSDVAHVPVSQNVPGLLRDLTVIGAAKMPVIAYLHGGAYGSLIAAGGVRGVLMRLAFARVVGIACLYDAQCEELRSVGVRQPMLAVGNVAPRTFVSPRPSQSPQVPFRVLFLGQLSRAKGFDILCEAVRDLDALAVTAVGDWIYRDRNLGLGDLSRNMRLPPNVAVHPPAPPTEIPLLLKQHDVLVLPSHSEGMPMAVLEAMNAGIPVIASMVGGLGAFARDGYITPLRTVDSQSLKRALLQVWTSYADALVRADQARQMVQQRYTESEIACRVAQLVEASGRFQRRGLGQPAVGYGVAAWVSARSNSVRRHGR